MREGGQKKFVSSRKMLHCGGEVRTFWLVLTKIEGQMLVCEEEGPVVL